MTDFTLSDLEKIVATRARAAPEESWTAKLVAAGQTKAAKKLARRRWKGHRGDRRGPEESGR